VGEIRDEYEADETKLVEAHADGTFTVRGSAPVSEFNRASAAGLPAGRHAPW
jgi:CBS domain containing-hemolysin-like protein